MLFCIIIVIFMGLIFYYKDMDIMKKYILLFQASGVINGMGLITERGPVNGQKRVVSLCP